MGDKVLEIIGRDVFLYGSLLKGSKVLIRYQHGHTRHCTTACPHSAIRTSINLIQVMQRERGWGIMLSCDRCVFVFVGGTWSKGVIPPHFQPNGGGYEGKPLRRRCPRVPQPSSNNSIMTRWHNAHSPRRECAQFAPFFLARCWG